MTSTKVAVVTGGNKGIGFAIVRGICKRFDGVVYLTARDEARGKAAVSDLEKEGLHPKFYQLDITNPSSVEKFRDYIKNTYGGIDILVNNAAIAFKVNATEPAAVQAEQTIFVNYTSLLSTYNILYPILRNKARVVNLSSSAGHLSRIPGEELKKQLADPSLTVDGLTKLMNEYVEAAKKGTQAATWGSSSYVASKVGVSALTRILQKNAERDIIVNSVHPGYVDTDMTSHKGPLTIDEGAEAPIYLALDAPDSIKGQYVWRDCSIIQWDGELAANKY